MSYNAPRIVRYQGGLLKNGAYGFPRGEKRRRKPWIIACVHISGNKRTASAPVGIGSNTGTRAEVSYMARDRRWASDNPDYGNSAHTYVARNGDMLDCIPWWDYAAWNNGDLRRPNTKLASVRRIISTKEPFNPNEAFWWEVEATGFPGSYSLTAQQRESIAYRIAVISIKKGIGISRNTVLLHADLDSVNRANCPFSAKSREEQVRRLIARANAIKKLLTMPEPEPEPDPDPEPDDCEERLNVALGELEAARTDIAEMSKALSDIGDITDRFERNP